MHYEGKLYARLGDKYIPLKNTAEEVDSLVTALEEIKNWDEDLHEKWGDPGERANDALNKFLKNDIATQGSSAC
ncbi:MAG: hypothetical protein ACWA44_02650 [Thiotrichales bacterium]